MWLNLLIGRIKYEVRFKTMQSVKEGRENAMMAMRNSTSEWKNRGCVEREREKRVGADKIDRISLLTRGQ